MSDMPIAGYGFHYEDLPVGRKFRTVGRTVTEADITAFVGATGMVEVLFTNLEHLRHESVFDGKRVVPAALVFTFAEGLVLTSTMQGTGLAFLSMDMVVHSPTFAGDTFHVECEVVETRRTSKPGRGIVKTVNRVVRHNGEAILTYTPSRLVRTRGEG